eukprot:g2313.t1
MARWVRRAGEVEEQEVGTTTTPELLDNKAEDAAGVAEGEQGEQGEGEGGAAEDGVAAAVAGLEEEPASGARKPWTDSWVRRRLHQSRCTSMSADLETPPR